MDGVNSINSDLVGSYAMLKSIWTESDYFVPFERLLLTLLHNRNIAHISDIRSICQEFQDYWHIDITYMAMQSLLARLLKKGCVTRSNSSFNIIITKIDSTVLIPKSEIDAYEADYDTLINNCQDYVKRVFKEELAYTDINICFASILKAQASQILVGEYQAEEVSTEKKYYISSYITYIAKNDVSKLALLNDIAFRHILSCCISLDGDNIPKSLSGLNIYLDTTFIFHFLGIDLLDRREIYTQLVNDLYDAGANLYLFQSNLTEINNILQSASYWVPNPLYDDNLASISSRYFKQKRWTAADIQELNSGLLGLLSESHITIHPGFLYPDLQSYCQDEKQIFDIIRKEYKKKSPWIDFDEKEASITIDARTINLLFCYREGRTSQNLLECQHVFVTTNESLIRATQNYEREIMKLPSANISACVSDSFIGLVMWLNQPTKLLEMSHRRLLAIACAAFIPTDRVRDEFRKQLIKSFEKGRITQEEYYTMRSLPVVQSVLMDICKGNIVNITEHTPEEILDRIKQDAREAERLRLEKEGLIAELTAAISSYSSQLRENAAERDFIENHLMSLVSQLDFYKGLRQRYKKVRRRIKLRNKALTVVFAIAIVAFVLYAAFKLPNLYIALIALATVILPIVLVVYPYAKYILTNKTALNRKQLIQLYNMQLSLEASKKSGYNQAKHEEAATQHKNISDRIKHLMSSKSGIEEAINAARETLNTMQQD